MNKLFFLAALLMLLMTTDAQTVTKHSVIWSENVRDSFDLFLSVPDNMDAQKSYDVIYYCDANLKSGRKLRELISSGKYDAKVRRTIFVGIGHIGNFHELRRRDFILPSITGNDTSGRSAGYGQTERFYQFLAKELVPQINARYKINRDNNSILGHSLGGLFAFYCLFKNEALFKNYFALSPALWIDRYAIYKFNRLTNNGMEKHLYFSAGSLEVMNHIKKGTDAMEKFLEEKKYQDLSFTYRVHKGKTHNSQVELSLAHILSLP